MTKFVRLFVYDEVEARTVTKRGIMFSNLKVLRMNNNSQLKIGAAVEIEGLNLIVFGYSKGAYLAWSGPGTTIYRIE